MKYLFLCFGMLLGELCFAQHTLEPEAMSHVAFYSSPIDSLDFLWLEDAEIIEEEWEDEERAEKEKYALAYHRDFGQTLLIYSDTGFMAYSFTGENYLRLYEWHLQMEQLNDGQKEVIIGLGSSYGRGYCHSSWSSDLEEVFILDLDRKQVLATLVGSEHSEEWTYPNGCEEVEEEIGSELLESETVDEEELEILTVYQKVERLIEVARGKLLIETIIYEVEDDSNRIDDGYYAWDGKALVWKSGFDGE